MPKDFSKQYIIAQQHGRHAVYDQQNKIFYYCDSEEIARSRVRRLNAGLLKSPTEKLPMAFA